MEPLSERRNNPRCEQHGRYTLRSILKLLAEPEHLQQLEYPEFEREEAIEELEEEEEEFDDVEIEDVEEEEGLDDEDE